jgi:hypothetical protein
LRDQRTWLGRGSKSENGPTETSGNLSAAMTETAIT